MKGAADLLHQVQAKSFLAHDILLYLDTHPDDRAALEAYRHALAERCEAVKNYERHVRALTPDGQLSRSQFDWDDDPFPWQ